MFQNYACYLYDDVCVPRLYVGVVDKGSNKMSILPASLTAMSPLQPGVCVGSPLLQP